MNNAELKKCKNKGCNNLVLDGKYCEHCKHDKKEKRDNFLKVAGPTVISMLLIAVKLKKNPK